MVTAAHKKLKGRCVRFLVRDVHIPEPTTILHELHGQDELKGRVLDVSDSAHADGSPFAVIKVPRLRRSCVVSVDRLLRAKKAPVEL